MAMLVKSVFRKVLVCALFFVFAGTAFSAVYYNADFDSTDPGTKELEGGTITTVDNPFKDATNNSNKVARCRVNNGGKRAEYTTPSRLATNEKKYVYRWMYYIPSNFQNAELGWRHLTQWKTWPCSVCADYGDVICFGCGGIFDDIDANDGQFKFRWRAKPDCNEFSTPLAYDRWISFVMDIYWTNTSNGYVKLWRDGVLLKELNNIKTLFDRFPANGSCNIRWAVGLYGPLTGAMANVDVFIDNISIADEDNPSDSTPPSAPGAVRDGTSTAADAVSTNFSTQLSANWTAAVDNESGIASYKYAIGTSAGGSQTAGWTTIGNVTQVTRAGLTLTAGTTYYFSVRAVNGSGLEGPAANSNGQYVVVTSTAGKIISGSTWQNIPVASQSGQFKVEFDMKPLNNNMDGMSTLSFGASDAPTDNAVLLRFAPSGIIDARNGGSYEAATSLAYSAGAQYHASIAVDMATRKYSVTVTPAGGSAVAIANNYAFRTEQNTITSINNFGVYAGAGSHEVSGIEVSSVPAADTTPPSAPGIVRDGTSATADSSSTTSSTQLSANWTPSADSESGISGYNYAIGSSPGATNITNWTALGNVLTVTKTGLSLIIGTTYYFSVKAVSAGGTGTAANSNGQVVTSTAVADTTPPSAPGIVRDGAVAGTDAAFTYSTTTLSANWASASDADSGIAGYEYAIGTTAGGAQVLTWTSLGNVLVVTRTGLYLSAGTTYYFSVRARNGYGLAGSAANSSGQYVKVINAGDTTPPVAITEVRDGTGAADDTDTYATTELSANWDASVDDESGISRYYYAIGTSPGSVNAKGWTDNGIDTEVTVGGLSLVIGTTYYFSVKAQNGVGLQGTVTNSNGQYIVSLSANPPVITNVRAAGVTPNSVVIEWDTDIPATSQVEYGLSASYGLLTIEDGNLATGHSVDITGLSAGRTYHYRVVSKDSGDGNQSISPDYAFSTPSPPTLGNAGVNAYPNPCDFSNGEVIKFKVGAAGSEFGEVKIYTLSGKLVRKMTAQPGATEISWDGTNQDGQEVATGIYLYTITQGSDKTTGKLAVIW